ncbi:DUF6221 family protein [Rhodococcus globerulus]|uniref:DUF6221 family protein n=1 Tax=Rhodococcus globerulus TaxID=33008 RepID=A0ABU4BS69_RHOGO|nr:DUF6221 family protein [Rhodococcus globerulus]MDV6267061.1 DUF6221 family protein [Rhodococcus globerulus]
MNVVELVEFVEARLAEDERVAREAIVPDRPGTHWEWEARSDDGDPESPLWLRTVEEFPTTSGVGDLPGFPLGYECTAAPTPAMGHITRHDPDRVLREVEAKQAIIEKLREGDLRKFSGLLDAVKLLASPFSDHPDYQKEWAL